MKTLLILLTIVAPFLAHADEYMYYAENNPPIETKLSNNDLECHRLYHRIVYYDTARIGYDLDPHVDAVLSVRGSQYTLRSQDSSRSIKAFNVDSETRERVILSKKIGSITNLWLCLKY